jgi:hypothetical protein
MHRVNDTSRIPSSADELARTVRAYAKHQLISTPSSAALGATGDFDKRADQIIDQSLESFWTTWLPRIVKAVALLFVCCCCGILALISRQAHPKAGHQS